jgi:hypothetical protein
MVTTTATDTTTAEAGLSLRRPGGLHVHEGPQRRPLPDRVPVPDRGDRPAARLGQRDGRGPEPVGPGRAGDVFVRGQGLRGDRVLPLDLDQEPCTAPLGLGAKSALESGG